MKNNPITRRDFLKLLGATGFFTLGHSLVGSVTGSTNRPTSAHPNVLILLFDALSAVDMSFYGYPRPTTPNFERFTQKATVFHRHYATGSFTTPGTASLLTGVLPWTHRAINLQGTTSPQFQDNNLFSLIPTEYQTFAYTHNSLAQILLDQFRGSIDDLHEISELALFSDIWTEKLPLNEFRHPFEAELLSTKNNFSVNSSLVISLMDEIQRTAASGRLSEDYKKKFPRGLPNCRPDGRYNTLCFTLETAIDWIANQFNHVSQPFLGYVHLFPPHAPYNPRREFINIFDDRPVSTAKPEHHFSQGVGQKELTRQRRRYDESIAYVDAEFGRLISLLENQKALDSTILVVTSDHGELFERGISGHNTEVLYEPLVRIPLLISTPGQTARVDIHAPTQAIDVLPTILNIVASESGARFEGQALPFDPHTIDSQRELYIVEAKSSPKNGRLDKATFAMISGEYKLIYYRGYKGFDEQYELFNLENDPEELVNLFSPADPVAQQLKARLLSKLKSYI